ncbi:hypothetical protein CF336_g6122 [Tilletia laevis]|nr:hypothetical protein CF336_g6122 [Tilletia laevis]
MFDTTPTGKTDMETVLAALNASSEAISCRFDHFEAGLADLKASNTMATIGATPGSPRSPSPRMPSVPAVGTKPGVAFRPLQTPMHGTPTACGVSGFYVPVTPKKAKDTADVGMGLDETSPEVRRLKAELWSTCLAIVERDDENATADELAAKTDKMVAEHWLLLREDRIARAFGPEGVSKSQKNREMMRS